jgi:predicted NBD/HSP70 family sugar kinase
LNKLTAFYDQLVSNLNHRLLGIGISTIGPINKSEGIILNPPNFYGLENIRIKEHFEHHTGLPVCFDNTMNASALAEKLFGYGSQLDNFVYLGIANGVGAGVISNGHLLNGHTGINGEIGHTSINFDGPLCSCGNRGCLEMFTSTSAIVNNARAMMQKAGLIVESDLLGWEELALNARGGEQYSLNALDEFCGYLSIGIVNLVNLFDCDAVFLGHEIALVSGLIEEKLTNLVNERIFSRKLRKIEIKMSYFGENVPIVGAACNVLYRLFEKYNEATKMSPTLS